MSSLPPDNAPQSLLPAWAVAEGPFGIRLLDAGIVALVIAAVEVNVIIGSGPGTVPLNLTAYLFGALLAIPILFRHRWPFQVRLVLVPAVMELLGPANWWLPSGLDRLLPGGRAPAPGSAEPSADRAAAR